MQKIKEFKITDNDSGQRLDRFTAKAVPGLPASLVQKYIRKKRIKVDGKSSSRDYRIKTGDTVQMYINDEFFNTTGRQSENTYLSAANSELDIVFEDINLLLLNKPAGMLCHSTHNIYQDSLISRVQSYLYKNGEWDPHKSNTFSPSLCNRIDRNTSGLVIAAKNAPTLRIVCEKLKLREIDKYYIAVVHGKPVPPVGTINGYIFKDSVKNRVYIYDKMIPGAKTAIMEYKTLKATVALSLLECRLITGRTHQIRAQLSYIGHPLLGDRKYGRGDLDKKIILREKYKATGKQVLCSYKVSFSFKTDAEHLSYLDSKTFALPLNMCLSEQLLNLFDIDTTAINCRNNN